jgi:hypothetical protein
LFKTRAEQLDFRKLAVVDPSIAFPDDKVRTQLIDESLESHKFGKKKLEIVRKAIADVSDYWLRDALLKQNVERFFE